MKRPRYTKRVKPAANYATDYLVMDLAEVFERHFRLAATVGTATPFIAFVQAVCRETDGLPQLDAAQITGIGRHYGLQYEAVQ